MPYLPKSWRTALDRRFTVKLISFSTISAGGYALSSPKISAHSQQLLPELPVFSLLPPELPPLADRVDTALQQFALAREDKGEHIACLEARKHFTWYLRGVPHSGFYKEQVSNISAFSDIERLAKEIKRDLR